MTDDIRGRNMTWDDLCKVEPQLRELETEISNISDADPEFCANRLWYGDFDHQGYKGRLVRLVGWQARKPKLRTIALYDLAYKHLYDMLPDCRHPSTICPP